MELQFAAWDVAPGTDSCKNSQNKIEVDITCNTSSHFSQIMCDLDESGQVSHQIGGYIKVYSPKSSKEKCSNTAKKRKKDKSWTTIAVLQQYQPWIVFQIEHPIDPILLKQPWISLGCNQRHLCGTRLKGICRHLGQFSTTMLATLHLTESKLKGEETAGKVGLIVAIEKKRYKWY